jgi:GTPase SAR1 family protein
LKKDDKLCGKTYVMTKGLDVEVSEVAVPNTNIVVDLFLFDMGGQSIFNQRQMAKRFWENCSYIICVFDVSSRKSLQSVKTWVASVRSASTTLLDIPTILVANKIDLREVSFLLWETIQV